MSRCSTERGASPPRLIVSVVACPIHTPPPFSETVPVPRWSCMRTPFDPPHETARFLRLEGGTTPSLVIVGFLVRDFWKQKYLPAFCCSRRVYFYTRRRWWRMERAYSAAAVLSFATKTEREDFLLKQRERSTREKEKAAARESISSAPGGGSIARASTVAF